MKKSKYLKLLHNGNNSKTILISINNNKYVIKRYYMESSLEFLREFDILRSLDHKNIIKPVNITRFIAFSFDFVGKSLRSFILNKKLLKENVKSYSLQIVKGLRYIHSKDIIHFDLKPENIIIKNNIVKIIDFGSAKYINEVIKAQDFTNTYTSLEYLLSLSTAHYFKDIWSFGCIFYEMIFYRHIFENENTFKLVFEILKVFGSPTKESYKNLNVKHLDFFKIFGYSSDMFDQRLEKSDEKLKIIVKKMFEMNPFDRITAKDLLYELEEYFKQNYYN